MEYKFWSNANKLGQRRCTIYDEWKRYGLGSSLLKAKFTLLIMMKGQSDEMLNINIMNYTTANIPGWDASGDLSDVCK
jgi:hypothetical protein